MDSAEQIVRDLAAQLPPRDSEWNGCLLCPEMTGESETLTDHDPACPWRRARELYPDAVPAPK